MPTQTDIVTLASEFVSRLFQERLPDYLVYHRFEHTETVAGTACKIGKGMKLGEEGMEVVMLAAWFHDTGYTEKYRGHEEISVRIATEFLKDQHYSEEKIRLVSGCIMATKIPQQPHNILEEIVADADLAGLGRKSFFKQSELLHHEWETAFNTKYSEEEWARQNLDLLREHRYFTSFASKKYREKKTENILSISKKIHLLNSTVQEMAADPNEYPDFPSNDEARDYLFQTEAAIGIKPDSFSVKQPESRKAQIMVTANAIIIGAGILALVFVRLSEISIIAIVIPPLLLLGVSILSITFSLLGLRREFRSFMPGEDIDMISKRYLHTSYGIFLYGIPISVAVFILLFLLGI
jgi:predicted metal-dependent HD superfamily phosphohydrolase